MISTDFAPNEDWRDALNSFYRNLKPWTWHKGQYFTKVKKRLKKYFPGHEIFLFLTGRAALYKALQSLSLKKGAGVMVVGFTCEAVILPILELGFRPIFVDIDKQTFSMDVNDVEKKINENVHVIILQHTFGITPHREEILTSAKKHNVTVIEDLAQGFDEAVMKKDPTDSIKLLSFGRSKALSSVFGGALATRDPKLAEKLKNAEKNLPFPSNTVIQQGLTYKVLAFFVKTFYGVLIGKVLHKIFNILEIIPKELSKKEREGEFDNKTLRAYPNALASLLNFQLKKFDQMQKKRLSVTEKYNEIFGSLAHAQPLSRYPKLIQEPDILINELRKKNIYVGRWYPYVLSPKGECPIAEQVASQIINLPTLISERQAERITRAVELHEHKNHN